MKDYKRITFYLCTTEDLSFSEASCSDDEDVNIVVGKKRELPNIFDEKDDFFDEVAGPSGCSTCVPSTGAKVSEKEVKQYIYFWTTEFINFSVELLISCLESAN